MTDQEGAISGRISDRPVADLFQWLHDTRRTGVAKFRTALGTATVWLREGELVDADMGRFHHDAAVLRLMRIQDGEYEVEWKPVAQRRMIKQSTALLLAEGRQRAPRHGTAGREVSTATPSPRSAPGASAAPAGPGASGSARSPSAVPMPGTSGSHPMRSSPGSGEYSLARDESRPRPRSGEGTAASSGGSEPRRGARVDSGAHTILNAKPPPRPPAKAAAAPAASSTDAQTVVGGRRSPSVAAAMHEPEPARLSAARPESQGSARVPAAAVAIEGSGQARGPAARRRMGWSPTAGGSGGQAPEPTPSARSASMVPGRPATEAPRPAAPPPEPTAEAEDGPPRSGRTRFMFGVSGPGAEREPSSPPVVARAEPIVPAAPEAPRFGEAPRSGMSTPAPGAIATPVPVDDSVRSTTESRPRRARAVARAQAPFEPERTDRTLLRPGPLPPPPGQPVVIPASGSQAIPIGTPASPSQAIPVATPSASPFVPTAARVPSAYVPATNTTAVLGSDAAERPPRPPAATPFGTPAPVFVDEEYSHPISVPTVPSMAAGPGGTWMLGNRGMERPLPEDPDAEQTISMRAPDVVQPREPSLSGHVKGGGTAHVGRYEVLLRLARGGMGTVYLCRVTGEGGFRRLFALKVIRDHLNTNQAYVQMLLEEARIASRLSHPNIVSILDIDTFAGQHYLVMDYVEGCTLSELLKAHPKTRPPELVVPIVLDALTGLHAAHSMRGDDGSSQPVVHCDFSPQNMLVGVNGTCRLTDFGVSKAADALPNGPGRGKPGYLSPEQVRGLPLDPRSDIFSAGVVLWNALTGEQLFDGEDPQQVLHQVVTRKIPKPSSVGVRPPACFDRICQKALERDPARRYQSAEQMLTELRKVAIAEDLLAPSSAVGQWVQETFGAQIELRRQAAGLQPNPAVAALALRDFAAGGPGVGLGPSGHSEGLARDGSVTGHDPDASMTMMIRGEAPREELGEDREGLGARTRMVVVVAALAFIAAGVVTLFVRPDLLQGGIIDERGQYIDLSDLPDREPLTGPGPADADADATTNTTPMVAGATAADTDAETDATTDTGGAPALDPDDDPELTAEDDPKGKGKPTKGKGKPEPEPDDGQSEPDDGQSEPKPTKGKPTKGKGKTDDGGTAPPPDLDELFRPPGG